MRAGQEEWLTRRFALPKTATRVGDPRQFAFGRSEPSRRTAHQEVRPPTIRLFRHSPSVWHCLFSRFGQQCRLFGRGIQRDGMRRMDGFPVAITVDRDWGRMEQ
jgi:hypothetical protein